MDRGYFYVLSFDSTSHAIQTEKRIKGVFDIAVIPTPREITSNCGLSIKVDSQELDRLEVFVEALQVPTNLYRFSHRKTEAGREVCLIKKGIGL